MSAGRPSGGEHRPHQVAEAARPAGAQVEQPGHAGIVQQPEHHRDAVIDMDEVALLLAIGDALPVGTEQRRRPPAAISCWNLTTLIMRPLWDSFGP